jgi:hypothetical protein
MNSLLHQERTCHAACQALVLPAVADKPVLLDFDGGRLSSDAGLLLLQQVDQQIGLSRALASVLSDPRDQRYTKHTIEALIRQRVYQIAAGYEDANDANALRRDPILKLALGRLPESDPPLASQPTISRFENQPSRTELYRLAEVLLEAFIASYAEEPALVVLDFDDTKDRVHGGQQLALFNAYYDAYCYLPLHVYEGLSGRLITTILKPKQLRGHQALALLHRLVAKLRQAWPSALIIFRGDSHFTYSQVMDYVEAEPNMGYVTGLQTNAVLKRLAAAVVDQAQQLYRYRDAHTEQPVKVTRFHSVRYRAGTWSRYRRVVIKVEVTAQGVNTRFVVTDLEQARAQRLYRDIYCARGAAEGYIKDHKTYLQSDRTSCHRFEANQFRLLLHSAAYVLLETLRREVLRGTAWSRATMATLRVKLLKIGARVRELNTRIKVALPSSCPAEPVLRQSLLLLARLRPG